MKNLSFKRPLSLHLLKLVRLSAVLTMVIFISVSQAWAVNKTKNDRNKINFVSSQQQTITGKVIDEAGYGLPGVTVIVSGTTNGTITDTDGNYTIGSVPGDGALKFSFVGMITQEVSVSGKSVINITLEEETIGLEEVVATGYATEKKKDIIGSVSVVDTDELQSTASGNITTQLQGRAAGVNVSLTGSPGSAGKIRIRGISSFSGSDPLYIVDGVAGGSVNPNDIESIQVLKDAASASIYGARAGNGVIIITTKKGKAGATKVSVDSYYGLAYSNNFPELLNTQEWGDLLWDAKEGAGIDPEGNSWGHVQYGYGDEAVVPDYIYVSDTDDDGNVTQYYGAELESMKTSDSETYGYLTSSENYDVDNHKIIQSGDTDWYKEAFRTAQIQSHQISISGGSDNAVFKISLNYYDQEGTTLYSDYQKYTARANSEFTILDKVRVGENIEVTYSDTHSGVNTEFLSQMLSIVPVWDVDGNPAGNVGSGTGYKDLKNPVTEAWRNRFDKSWSQGVSGHIYAEADLFKDLTFRTTLALNSSSGFSYDASQTTTEHRENTNASSLSVGASFGTGWTWTNLFTYTKELGKHSFKLMVGSEASKSISHSLNGSRTGYAIEDSDEFWVLDTGTDDQTNGNSYGRSASASYFGRFDYTYDDKYIFNATLRRDGSSNFADKYKWGNFPALAVGWRISSESFMQDEDWLDDLKLRSSWGIIGNQSGLSSDNQYDTYTLGDADQGEYYAIDGSNTSSSVAYVASTIGNKEAHWEESKTLNLGVDAVMFNNKLSITAEWFYKKTSDLLVPDILPLTGSSADAPKVNLGDLKNTGIEFAVEKRGNITKDLGYDVTATFSKYKNVILKISEDDDEFYAPESDAELGQITRSSKGKPISYFYGYELDGFYNSEEEVAEAMSNNIITPRLGGWKIKDVNEDGSITEDDMTMIGDPHPDFQVSANITLTYKNFDMTAFWYWNQGGEIFNKNLYYTDFFSLEANHSPRMLTDSWTEDNHDAKLPALDYNDTDSYSVPSSYFVEDASYIRLKTLQIGYTVPENILDNLRLEKLRFYIQAQNLLTITKYRGLDPDLNMQGDDTNMGYDDNLNVPVPKQVIFGLNVSF